jgi:hypothetical protein
VEEWHALLRVWKAATAVFFFLASLLVVVAVGDGRILLLRSVSIPICSLLFFVGSWVLLHSAVASSTFHPRAWDCSMSGAKISLSVADIFLLFPFFRIRPPWLGLPGGHGCGNFLPSFFLRGSWMHFAFVFRFSSPPRFL